MPSFESFNKKPTSTSEGKTIKESFTEVDTVGSRLEKVKDYLFDQYLKQQLLEDFFDHLEEYLDETEIEKMRGELALYNDSDIYSTLSIPHELRDRKFENFRKAVSEGKDPTLLMREFVQASKRYGYSIGYHTSPNDIKPNESGQWTIKGFEKDHRDSDLSKAYYSTKYRHLFKKKDPKFIYLVRTDPETHSTDGNWSRAGNLSVITKVPFHDVVEYVESTVRDMERQKEKADANASAVPVKKERPE